MPVTVVVGPPFSGKGQFARDEIARREADGELGLVAVDYTSLYSSITPGVQSSFRDAAVSETGAPRLAGYLYAVALAALLDRELSGYVLTPNPARAIEIADKARAPIVAIEASVDEIAARIGVHVRDLSWAVPRATRDRTRARCGKAAATYFRGEHQLVGRARTATKRGNRWRVGERKAPFDRAAFERGLTPRGRAVRDELIAAGTAEPTPAQILSELIRERRVGTL